MSDVRLKESEASTSVIDENEIIEINRMKHNIKVLNQLQQGDLVVFKNSIYSQWAVFIGNEKVIHLNSTNTSSDGISNHASANLIDSVEVKISKFYDLSSDSYAYRNNSKDSYQRVLPINEILARAYSKVGYNQYDLFTKNCEKFANYCRYDIKVNDQSKKLFQFGCQVTKAFSEMPQFFQSLFRFQCIPDSNSTQNEQKNILDQIMKSN